jgi:hypothetical protein
LIVSRQLKWLFADWSGWWWYFLGIGTVDGVNVPKLAWIFSLAGADEGILRLYYSGPREAKILASNPIEVSYFKIYNRAMAHIVSC